MLAVGTGEGRVRLVDLATGIVRWDVLSHPKSRFHSVAMSPDGRFVASVADSAENWKLLEVEKGVEWMKGASRHDGIGACICSLRKSGRRKSLDERCPVKAHSAGLVAVGFSMCNKWLATGGDDRSVILWDARTGKAEQVMQGHTERVSSVSFSADGMCLASGSWDGSICIWDAAKGALLRRIQEDESMVSWVHFSPTNSRRLASAGYGMFVRQWDVDSGNLLSSLRGYSFATFSPDGHTIATGGAAHEGPADVHLVDAETGAVRLRIGHPANVFSVSFSVNPTP